MKQAGERAWGQPAPCRAASAARGSGDPAVPGKAGSAGAACSRALSPRPPGHATAAAPSACTVFLSLAFPRRWFCPESSAGLFLPAWSSWQLAACVGALQVSLGCSAGSGVGWLQALEDSPVLLLWKTLSVTTENGDGA